MSDSCNATREKVAWMTPDEIVIRLLSMYNTNLVDQNQNLKKKIGVYLVQDYISDVFTLLSRVYMICPLFPERHLVPCMHRILFH